MNCLPSEVIAHKFEPDYRFLIIRYKLEIENEIEQSREIKAQMKNIN